ncbi:ATP-binding protein [Streptomyces griseocarneus]|uniref:ATP-binding protein n=1 Tax=Streptomyces griseocarneus TaxID=51201 RepID=UPI00167CD5C9|nr:ATP-binding protein [Streptomyces griseocarneus]MBZ6473105.1 ATP-binding protein [Streptomyces griseocarneus]
MLSTPRHHTTASYHLSAPADVTTPRLARQFVTGALQATRHATLIDNACVCVSDVVTNVVQHARVTDLSVELTAYADRVVIGVRDADPTRRPARRRARPDDERGRGLALVQTLADSCGMALVWDRLTVTGKLFWFELRDS